MDVPGRYSRLVLPLCREWGAGSDAGKTICPLGSSTRVLDILKGVIPRFGEHCSAGKRGCTQEIGRAWTIVGDAIHHSLFRLGG